jgi:ankyrin repeat protein
MFIIYFYIVFIFIFIFQNGYTALMIAAEKNHFEIVKLLIENNADINIHNAQVFFIDLNASIFFK